MISVDGGAGLLAALPKVYGRTPVQRCGAHKIRNLLNKVRAGDQKVVKRFLHPVMNAPGIAKARDAARRFADRWKDVYPKAVSWLRDDLDELLTCFRYKTEKERKLCEPPTPLSRAFAKCAEQPDPWASFRTKPAGTASSSRSSPMRTNLKASASLSC
ncbi:MAG TPA: transposase [Methylocella sp.]|nr:transposase [Methylocella sp.]